MSERTYCCYAYTTDIFDFPVYCELERWHEGEHHGRVVKPARPPVSEPESGEQVIK